MTDLDELGRRAGVVWFDYQEQALVAAAAQPGPSQRRCLYYKTGAGKSVTSLAMVRLWGYAQAVVIAPPSTHQSWEEWGRKIGTSVTAISHAKFRMKDTKMSRNYPIIVDEFHMLGGHGGQGFKKMQTLARHLQAPMVLCSATPNYNDAERVYCIQSILDPQSTKGGYLNFLYRECQTEADPFSMTPKVVGFHRFKDAAEYLAALPNVDYVEDDLVYQIVDVPYLEMIDSQFEYLGYDRRNHRIVASGMEERHTRRFQGLVNEHGYIHGHVEAIVLDLVRQSSTPVLIFANHATVAKAMGETFYDTDESHALVTGETSKKMKDEVIQRFRSGDADVLIGTASLATGTDGLDKVCDTLIILDDTDDDSLRRQLIGRIMPRGSDTDASRKQVFRLVPQ